MYEYILKEGVDPLFSFTTKHGLNYFITFRKMDFGNAYFQNLYSVDFWEMGNQKFYKDAKIEITITTIICNYFKSHPNSILHYVCDSMDLKQDYRKRLFDQWYKKFQTKEFSKLNFEYQIQEENINYNLGFIFKNDCYEMNEVIENITLQLDEFTSLK
ncbi:DUF6169 family protein [Flavobacterium sp. N3904]|uniref:DUF6169 family protein n=1 Tax=Flavobacterium sp. N3904 TaxID=2986835 RepID=UPI00222534C3|nr:DUF6169 family protein [Flavobacterium sp. N3904]